MNDTGAAPPKGWYPDPAGGPQWRFWTGATWTTNTAPWPSRPSGADIVALGRQARLTRRVFAPAAVIFTVALMDVMIHSGVSSATTTGEYVLLLYPLVHIATVRALATTSRLYGFRHRRVVPWIPFVGPLLWWAAIARVGRVPVWARWAPLWLILSVSATVVTDLYLRLVFAGTWIAGCLGVWVVTTGFESAVRTDTLPPLAP